MCLVSTILKSRYEGNFSSSQYKITLNNNNNKKVQQFTQLTPSGNNNVHFLNLRLGKANRCSKTVSAKWSQHVENLVH